MFSTSQKSWPSNVALIILLFPLLPVNGFTQVLQSDRLEIALAKNEQFFDVIPAQDQGLYLHRRLGGPEEDRFEMIRIDTAFQRVWHGYLPVSRKLHLMGKRATRDGVFLLLRNEDFVKKDFELLAIQKNNGSFIRYTIRNFIPFVPSDFQITQTAAIIGGYFNQIPVVIYYSFHTQKTKVVPGLFNEMGELTQVMTHDDGSFDVLISARNFKGQRTIWIKNYDAEGNLIRNFSLEPEGNRHLIFARSLKTRNDMQLVAGVYGGRNSEYSKGLFIASIDPTGLQQLRYYDFGDLENFFKYMKAKREQRVKNRIDRRKVRGKKTRFNYRFLVHQLVPYKNQYILLGEAFYPRYISLDRSYYSGFFNPFAFYPNSVVRNGRIFDGYRYTHAVVMGFDQKGRLIWDNSFEINDVKTFTLEQFVKLEIHEDKIALLYLFENELRTKIIKDEEVLEGKTIEPIRTRLESEIVEARESEPSKLDYWYHDYFYAYGVQEVLNPQAGKRRVFFINKITYGQ